jgi:SAM-dependent methyltransferase
VPKLPLDKPTLTTVAEGTVGYYARSAESFKAGTWDHDVSQNRAALLGAIETPAPHRLLDLGCGPGRDVLYFHSLGHEAVGLDACLPFVEMARAASGCEVLHQSFLELDLPPSHFDGVFANASLFHVPTQELGRVLGQLRDTLVPGGVLFCSNPRGQDTEGLHGDRYCVYHSLESWRAYVTGAGFVELGHYYRPEGKPRAEQPWLATVWRKPRP